MVEKFTNLRMIANESVIDEITRAEELQSILRKVEEEVSEHMLISILEVLTDDFDSFVTMCRFSKDEKNLQSFD